MNEIALKCMSTGDPPLFGYSLTIEKKFEIKMEADGVRLIFRMILEGKGFDTIIHELNSKVIKPETAINLGKTQYLQLSEMENIKAFMYSTNLLKRIIKVKEIATYIKVMKILYGLRVVSQQSFLKLTLMQSK